MTKQGSVWLAASLLLVALGIVYGLSTTSPPDKATAAPAGPAAREQLHSHPHPHNESVSADEVAFSPNFNEVNPYAFLDLIPVGKAAPVFSAQAADGQALNLAQYRGKKNVVLVFYQGSFCSVCGAQLSDFQKNMADFRRYDTEIIGISADDQRHALQTVGEYGLSFPIVGDAEKKIIQQFGVANIARKNIAYPSLYIVDKQGIVRFSYADAHGHRLHSAEVLPELKKIAKK